MVVPALFIASHPLFTELPRRRVLGNSRARGHLRETRSLQRRWWRFVYHAPVACDSLYRLIERLEPRSYADVAIGPTSVRGLGLFMMLFCRGECDHW